MTRYARAGGSKSSNKKVPDVGTPWLVLKKGLSKSCSRPSSESERAKAYEFDSSSRRYDFEDKGNVWCVIDDPEACEAVKRNHPRSQKGLSIEKKHAHFKSSGSALADKDESIDFDNKNVSRAKNLEESDNRVGKVESDKTGVKNKKMKGRKCFKCQRNDHVYKDCPEDSETGICFVCGSSEHTFRNCKRKKRNSNLFAFATCFVCKELGHIASTCPDNPVGLYPYGGACHDCGEVTHFSKDCPLKRSKASRKSFTLETWSRGDLEGLSEDVPHVTPSHPKKSIKIVHF